MTIVNAIQIVLNEDNKPLTHKEIYKQIIEKKLYEFGAQNPERIVQSTIRRHCYGLDFPSASKKKYFQIVVNNKSQSKYTLYDESKDILEQAMTGRYDNKDKLPEEKIYEALENHKKDIRAELLEYILSSSPSFFEELVMELLLKMGYGWDKKKAGLVSGKVGDGGIDGVIKEDKLGLGKIYIQAKRYSDNTIGRPDVQQFVGAMEHNQKGVYITTSTFSKQAWIYIEKHQKDIVLIDGEKLTELLIEHGVGIQVVQTFATYKIDKDFFE